MEPPSGWASWLRGGRVIIRVAVAVCLASALASPSFAVDSLQGVQPSLVAEVAPAPSAQQAPGVQTTAAVQTLAARPMPVVALQASLTPSEWPYFAGEAAMQATAVRALRWAFYA